MQMIRSCLLKTRFIILCALQAKGDTDVKYRVVTKLVPVPSLFLPCLVSTVAKWGPMSIMDVYYSCGCGMTFMAIVCRSLLFCDFRNFLLALNIERHSNVTHVAWRLQVYHCCQLVLELTPWRHARFPPAILGWKILATRNPVIERYDLGINTLIHEFLYFSSTIILCQRIISSECICGRDVWLKGSNCLVRMVKQITIKFTETCTAC